MKTTHVIIAFISAMFLSSFSSEKFPTATSVNESVVGVFDGHEDYGYNFLVSNDEGDEHTMTFQNVAEEVLKTFDLHSESLIGKKFKVTYDSTTDIIKDEDGYEDEVEVLTITALTAM